MFFTQEDFKKIEDYLKSRAIRDTEFQPSESLTGEEEISFIQDGKNVKTTLNKFLESFRTSNFINITEIGNSPTGTYTLEEAIDTVPLPSRTEGCIITYISSEDNDWKLYQFLGKSTDEWYDLEMWRNILQVADNHFKGAFENEDLLYASVPNPEVGDYAFVGLKFNESVIYRCRNRWVWSPTTENASDYIKVIVDGNITVGSNGNWFQNGEDTGIKAQGPKGEKGDSIKGDKGDTPVMRLDKPSGYVQYGYDGIHWENLVPLTEFVINNNPDDEDIIADDNNKLKFADKAYNPAEFSGLGRVILRKNIVQGKNVLTQEMINKPNTIYEIRYDFDLNDVTINVPENCTLNFQGGSLKDGILNGNNTQIKSAIYLIFKNIVISGNWLVSDIYSKWFNFGDNDNAQNFKNIINLTLDEIINTIYLSKGVYNSSKKDNLLNIKSNTNLYFNNAEIKSLQTNDRHFSIITIDNKENVIINGGIITGDIRTHISSSEGSSDEWCHGIKISGSKNITISNMTIRENVGDGIDVIDYSDENNPIIENKDIYINNNIIDNNGRQGISIESVDNITIKNNIISNTSKISYIQPGYGIDIEPWRKEANVRNVFIYDNIITNNKYGIYSQPNWCKESNIDNNINIINNKFDYTQGLALHSTKNIIIKDNISTIDDTKTNIFNISLVGMFLKNEDIVIDNNTNIRILNSNTDAISDNITIRNTKNTYRSHNLIGTFNYIKFENSHVIGDIGNAKTVEIYNSNMDYLVFQSIDTLDVKNTILTKNFAINFHKAKSLRVENCDIQLVQGDNVSHLCGENTIYKCCNFYILDSLIINVHTKNSIFENNFFNIKGDIAINSNGIIKFINNIFTNCATYGQFNIEGIPTLTLSGNFIHNVIPTKITNKTLNTTIIDTNNKMLRWNGTMWIDEQGNSADALKKGTTIQRPTGVQIGFTYKDTDLNKWIIWNGEAWENIDGTALI